MEDWYSQGCPSCRQGVLESGEQPRRIGVWALGPEFLHHCDVCGTYWRFTLRAAYVIDEAVARRDFPDVFVTETTLPGYHQRP